MNTTDKAATGVSTGATAKPAGAPSTQTLTPAPVQPSAETKIPLAVQQIVLGNLDEIKEKLIPKKLPLGSWHDFIVGVVIASAIFLVKYWIDTEAEERRDAAKRIETANATQAQAQEVAARARDLKMQADAERYEKEKERRAIRRRQAEPLLSEVADSLNKPISNLFRQIRTKNEEQSQKVLIEQFNEIQEGIHALYYQRLRVKVKAEAYLGSRDFSEHYSFIRAELTALKSALFEIRTSKDLKKDSKRISDLALTHIATLKDGKNVSDAVESEEIGAPYDDMFKWNSMLLQYVSDWLTEELIKAIDQNDDPYRHDGN